MLIDIQFVLFIMDWTVQCVFGMSLLIQPSFKVLCLVLLGFYLGVLRENGLTKPIRLSMQVTFWNLLFIFFQLQKYGQLSVDHMNYQLNTTKSLVVRWQNVENESGDVNSIVRQYIKCVCLSNKAGQVKGGSLLGPVALRVNSTLSCWTLSGVGALKAVEQPDQGRALPICLFAHLLKSFRDLLRKMWDEMSRTEWLLWKERY